MLRKIVLLLLGCSVAFAASAATVKPPTTRDELATAVKTYQNAKDCNGVLGLFYTEKVDQARKEAFRHAIEKRYCSNFNRRIFSIAFQDIPASSLKKPHDFRDTPSEYTLTPLGAIVIDYGLAPPGETKSLSFLYGAHNNRLYLITTRKAGAK